MIDFVILILLIWISNLKHLMDLNLFEFLIYRWLILIWHFRFRNILILIINLQHSHLHNRFCYHSICLEYCLIHLLMYLFLVSIYQQLFLNLHFLSINQFEDELDLVYLKFWNLIWFDHLIFRYLKYSMGSLVYWFILKFELNHYLMIYTWL